MRIGIMQGRLLPPVDGRFQCFPRERWSDEFSLAAAAGLDAIEWIYDLYGADVNPLGTDGGVARMMAFSAKHGVEVRSFCADYFMDKPLVRTTAAEREERVDKLVWLLHRGQCLKINRIVVPFVDASRIESEADVDCVVAVLQSILPVADETGIEIHLETSLSPTHFAELLAKIPHPKIKVNYDSGNSSSLGYRPVDEFAAYGERIGSVHIKDRIYGGGTVRLGTGDADLRGLAHCLKSVGYAGDYILQVARNSAGDEVAWARQNRAFLVDLLANAGLNVGDIA